MSMEMADAIHQLTQEKGYTEDQVLDIIENMLKAAYKREHGTNVNAIVKFSNNNTDVKLYSRKVIVDGVYDPVTEIELEDAIKYSTDAALGDEIDIEEDINEYRRNAIQIGKQNAHQSFSDIQKNSLLSEYKDKIGEAINGYYQREKNGNIYVDLGKVEGYLPVKNQSPREVFAMGDRIKALVVDVKKINVGLQLILSRSDPEFVRSLVETEVPEIYDKTVEIYKIVREAGYRTKIAVFSHKEDIDPVGACVGLKGGRIQAIIRELEGEKIDILKYDSDPKEFIKNALSPAEVEEVFILDEDKKQALAIVNESQFSLAIGKQGLNVRLANRLVDWNIDVKTADQCEELENLIAESRRAAQELFNDDEIQDEIITISNLPGVDENVVAILKENNIEDIQDFITAFDNDELSNIENLTQEDLAKIYALIEENVEFVEEEAEDSVAEDYVEDSEEVEEYECPECGAKITLDMTECPECGTHISFEYEE